jgi:hypothetical protein
VWRGPNPIGGTVSALDRQAFSGKEGVLLTVAPASAVHPSVACTASIPFVGVQSGICNGSASEEGHYAMFAAAGKLEVDIWVHTARPQTDVQLEELAQNAYQHTIWPWPRLAGASAAAEAAVRRSAR